MEAPAAGVSAYKIRLGKVIFDKNINNYKVELRMDDIVRESV
jgi:hypothetical protein